MATKKQEDIYRKLSYKYNLPIKTIREICSSPTEYVAEMMRTEDEESIFISGFGRFGVKAKRKEYVIKHRKSEAQTNNDAPGTGSSE